MCQQSAGFWAQGSQFRIDDFACILRQGADPYDFAEPVEVAKQLDKAFWEGLGAAKWTERRDALQRLKGVTGAPRLAQGDFGDLLRELKKVCLKDSNVVCVAETIACIGARPPLCQAMTVVPAELGMVCLHRGWT